MKFYKFNFTIILPFIFLICGCADFNDHVEGQHKNIGSLNSENYDYDPNLGPLTFENIKDKILDSNCINCHTDKHNAYANNSVVRLASSQMLTRMIDPNRTKRMPLNRDALKPELIELFQAWVSAGSPEFEDQINSTDEILELRYSFADIKANVFKDNNCLECHSHFEDYTSVIRELGSIVGTVQKNKMPYPKAKNGTADPLTPRQKEIMIAWVNQGAPEFVGAPPVELKYELEPDWLSLRNNLLGPKCILCHNSFGKRGPQDMSTYDSLMTWYTSNPKLFDISSPEESHFIGAILGRVDDDEFFFDKMPFDSSLDDVSPIADVTDNELSVLKTWVSLGLPE